MEQQPPKFYTRLFRWFCEDDFFEELEGDLEEKFYDNLEQKGARYARKIYRKEVLLMIRPSVLRKPQWLKNTLQFSLFKIHLKLTMCNMARNKIFSAVNIFGLAAALSLCLFFVNLLYTGYQMDTQHPHLDRFYRVTHQQKSFRGVDKFASNSFALGEHLKNDFPQIEKSTTVYNSLSLQTNKEGNQVNVEGIYVDSSFFDLFSFEVVMGDPKAIFDDINSVVLTEEAAVKLFGESKPLSEIIGGESIVKAIVKSPKSKSHLDFEAVGNIEGHLSNVMTYDSTYSARLGWTNSYSYYHYVRLKENTDPASLAVPFAKLAKEVDEYFENSDLQFSFGLQAVSDINFGEDLLGDTNSVFPHFIRNTFACLMVLIMLIASFNYTNLSIARALQRSKEIGVRKINGSTKGQIIAQFLVETCVFSLLALFIGFGIYSYLLPIFPQLAPEFSGLISLRPDYGIVLSFVLFSILLGVFSGILPSLYFSKTPALTAISKLTKQHPLSLINLRRVLAGFQLTLSMFSILVIFMINDYYKQMAASNLGFKSDDLVSFNLPITNEDLIGPVLEKIPEISQYTNTSFVPGAGSSYLGGVTTKTGQDSTYIHLGLADQHFTEVYKTSMLAGSGFSEDHSSADFSQVIVDIEVLNKLNISLDSAIGTQLTYTLSAFKGHRLEIVGVMDHYIMNALSSNLYPMVVMHEPEKFKQTMTLSFHEGALLSGIEKLEAEWAEVFPDNNLNIRFVDDLINDSYKEFKALIKVITFLGMVIICISLLGQLGLALYRAETKTKEIGIRKVLGAKAVGIILKLLKGTAVTIAIASAISVPLVYLMFDKGVAASITTPTSVSALPISMGIMALSAVTFVIIISQTWHIANRNPAESLRYE